MHNLIDPQPEVAGVAQLVIHHNADWSGYVEICWRETDKSETRRVSIRGPWLLQGFMRTERPAELPIEVACRAVAMACKDHAITAAREAIDNIDLDRIEL